MASFTLVSDHEAHLDSPDSEHQDKGNAKLTWTFLLPDMSVLLSKLALSHI